MANKAFKTESVIMLWFRSFEKLLCFKNEIKWGSVSYITLYHGLAFYMAICYAFPVKLQTLLFVFSTYVTSGYGVIAGAHRLWSHRSYKVKLPLKIWTLICFSMAGQNSVLNWVRDHRVHHKHSDTDADPHNINRGLFFAHVGWLMMKKNEEVVRRGKEIDLSDIQNDPVMRFHEKYFGVFKILFCYAIPLTINTWCLGEAWPTAVAWHLTRHLLTLHSTFSLNSLAHTYGYQPYNKNMRPTQNNFVSSMTLFSEGGHNYHHTFPFDYKGGESVDVSNFCTMVIRAFWTLGLAYDLKEVSPDSVKSVASRLGDGTHSSLLSKKAL